MKRHEPTIGHWSPLKPPAVATLLANINMPWWIAGGWALDLFLGCQTRPHGDLDVGVLRRDVTAVMANLLGWEFFEARSQVLRRLERGESPRPEVNSLWCRPANSTSWSLELMLDEADGDTWVFRRQPTVRRPLTEVIRRTPDGIPYLSPEIQLLYKAKLPREKDQEDFARVVPQLTPEERIWLRDALTKSGEYPAGVVFE